MQAQGSGAGWIVPFCSSLGQQRMSLVRRVLSYVSEVGELEGGKEPTVKSGAAGGRTGAGSCRA